MNYFAKKNYARAQEKKLIEKEFLNRIDGFTKSQLQELYEFIDGYQSNAKKLFIEFRSFLEGSIDNRVIDKAELLAVNSKKDAIVKELAACQEKLNDLESKNKFSQKGFFGRIRVDYIEYKENRERAASLTSDLEKFERHDYKYMYRYFGLHLPSNWAVSKNMFIDRAIRDIEKNKIQEFQDSFEEIGIMFHAFKESHFRKISSQEEWWSLVCPATYVFYYRPCNLPYGARMKDFRDKEPESWCFNFNYFEKWPEYDKERAFLLSLLNTKLSKIRKIEADRNLRALASEKTEQQRRIAGTQRTRQGFRGQTAIYDKCPYCHGVLGSFTGKDAAHLDHIHPVSKGGQSTIQNLVYICQKCNSSKSDQTLNSFIRSSSMDREKIFYVLDLLEKDY